MKINPIKEYKKPEYPNFEDFLSNSYSLSNYTPLKWRKNPVVWAAVLSIALSNQSCYNLSDNNNRLELIKLQNENSHSNSKRKKTKNDSNFIAPIFNHGNGFGTYGCMVAQPPSFINERDAINIINNLIRKNGIKLVSLYDTINVSGIYFNFDAYLPELNLGIYYVSEMNCPVDENESSVYDICPKREAERINLELKNIDGINAVVFYDPLAKVDFSLKCDPYERQYLQIKESRELLKAQVNDFIYWLKTEKLTKK